MNHVVGGIVTPPPPHPQLQEIHFLLITENTNLTQTYLQVVCCFVRADSGLKRPQEKKLLTLKLTSQKQTHVCINFCGNRVPVVG